MLLTKYISINSYIFNTITYKIYNYYIKYIYKANYLLRIAKTIDRSDFIKDLLFNTVIYYLLT